MMKRKQKVGVVLAGGGAKGAYEVGFLRALNEFKIQADAIAGTSIGALNGCLYSALRNTSDACKILKRVWNKLKNESPLKIDKIDTALHLADLVLLFYNKELPSIISPKHRGVLQTNPIAEILRQYAPIEKIKQGLPFYISISEAGNVLDDVMHLVDLNRLVEMKKVKTHYLKIQEIKEQNIYKSILASAALPFLFDAQEIDGKLYRDGCLGVNYDSSANAPILPLIEKEQCNLIFVCHLDNRVSFVERYKDLKQVRIVEVIPRKDTFASPLDPLRFNQEKIDFWIQQGYQDSKEVLKKFTQKSDKNSSQPLQKVNSSDVLIKIATENLISLMKKTKI